MGHPVLFRADGITVGADAVLLDLVPVAGGAVDAGWRYAVNEELVERLDAVRAEREFGV